jgi:anti-anti-sigma factor
MQIEDNGDVLLVRFLDPTLERPAIDGLLPLVEQPGRRQVIADLQHVGYIDSNALAGFIKLQRLLVGRKAELILRNLQPPVWDVIRVTRLDRFFRVEGAPAAP